MPVAVMVICPPSAQAAWVTAKPSCSANTGGVAGVAGGVVSSSAAAGVARASAATAPSTAPHLMIFTRVPPLRPPARCRRESVVRAARPAGPQSPHATPDRPRSGARPRSPAPGPRHGRPARSPPAPALDPVPRRDRGGGPGGGDGQVPPRCELYGGGDDGE